MLGSESAVRLCDFKIAVLQQGEQCYHPLLAFVVVVSTIGLDALVVLVHEVDAPNALDSSVCLFVDSN